MKVAKVVCAIIEHDGRILATQRGYGEFAGGWEFPGGKIEAGETPEEALEREIHEELDASIGIHELLCEVDYDYPTFHLSMKCFTCGLLSDHLELLEHRAARWLDARTIDSVAWLPADASIIQAIKDAGIV